MKGYLPETCVCRICQSQLGWTEIPGCGPDCKAVEPEPAPDPTPNYVASTGVLSAPDALATAVRRLKATAPESAEPIETAEPTEAAPAAEGAESVEMAREDMGNDDAGATGEDPPARGRGNEER
jgi:hypothetical protein